MPSISDRLGAVYRLTCPSGDVEARARAVGIEQTVEFPEHLLDPEFLERIAGRVTAIAQVAPGQFDVTIEYPIEVAGRELTQLVNVLFGNISLQPGIRLLRFALPETLSNRFRGPRFGRAGLRDLVAVPNRPLLCTAIKPLGRSPQELAEFAYRLALGGMDLIKDDHGLADQSFCSFAERIPRCAAAVARANRETGGRCHYLPNVTAPAGEVMDRARLAKANGAGGLLVCPGLVGLDAQRALADRDELALPILSHPAFQGAYCVAQDAGLAPGALFGQLNRLAGADATIFPHWGGRFAFSQAECRDLIDGTTRPMGAIRPSLPVPAGGLRLDRVAEVVAFYGPDCILLIGGDLHAQGKDLVANCQRLVRLVEQWDDAGTKIKGGWLADDQR